MRKAILSAASALALSSPAVAADLSVTPYSEVPSYEREVLPYAYRPAPPVVVEELAPIVSETFVVRRPVVVAPPPVVVEEYPGLCGTARVCSTACVCVRRSGLARRMGPSTLLRRPLVKSRIWDSVRPGTERSGERVHDPRHRGMPTWRFYFRARRGLEPEANR